MGRDERISLLEEVAPEQEAPVAPLTLDQVFDDVEHLHVDIADGIDSFVALENILADFSDEENPPEMTRVAHRLLVSEVNEAVDTFDGEVDPDMIPALEAFGVDEDEETMGDKAKRAAMTVMDAMGAGLKKSFLWIGKKTIELAESTRKYLQSAESAADELAANAQAILDKLHEVDAEPVQGSFMVKKPKRYFVDAHLVKGSELANFLSKANKEFLEPFSRDHTLGDGAETLSKALTFSKQYVDALKAGLPAQDTLTQEANAVIGAAQSALANAGKLFMVATHDSTDFDSYSTHPHLGSIRSWVKFPRVPRGQQYSIVEFPKKMAAIKAGIMKDSDMGNVMMTQTFDKDDLRRGLMVVVDAAKQVADLVHHAKQSTSNLERLNAIYTTFKLGVSKELTPAELNSVTRQMNNLLVGVTAFENAVARIRSQRIKAVLEANNAALDLLTLHFRAFGGTAPAMAGKEEE